MVSSWEDRTQPDLRTISSYCRKPRTGRKTWMVTDKSNGNGWSSRPEAEGGGLSGDEVTVYTS